MTAKFFISLFSALLFITVTTHATTNNRLVIISDEDNCESALHKRGAGALTKTLDYFVQENTAAILVSKSVLHQYLLQEANNASADPLACNVMHILKIHDTDHLNRPYDISYYLVIPSPLYEEWKKSLAINTPIYGLKKAVNAMYGLHTAKHLKPITPPLACANQWTALADIVAANTSIDGFESEFWANLFLTQENFNDTPELLRPWSIMFFCHGSPTATSGISTRELQKFFIFLSTELETNIVTMTCCYLGGNIKDELCIGSINNQQISYDFHLVMAGLSDVTQSFVVKNQGLAAQFFDQHENVANIDPAATINLFTQLVAANELYSNREQYGQIRLAGSTKFTIPHANMLHLTPNKNARNSSRKKVATQTKTTYSAPLTPTQVGQKRCAPPTPQTPLTPLYVANNKVTLLYEKHFKRPLEINPIVDIESNATASPIICADHYFSKLLQWQGLKAHQFPAITAAQKIISLGLSGQTTEAFLQGQFNPAGLHYPYTISMASKTTDYLNNLQTSAHLFNEITVSNRIPTNNAVSPFAGILRFVRDSYFCNLQQHSVNKIFIKTLRGYNDLSLLFECEDENKTTIHANMQTPGTFNAQTGKNLRKTLHHLVGKDLKLENVIIETYFIPEEKRSICYIAFTLNNRQDKLYEQPDYSAWECVFSIPEEKLLQPTFQWIFEAIDATNHNRHFVYETERLGLN